MGSHEKKLLEKQMGFHTFVSMSKAFVQMIESILLSTKERPLVATYKTSSERIDALNKEGKIELSELSWEDTICYDFIITGVVSLWEDPSNLRTGLHMMRRATWFLDKIANRLAPKGQLLVELDSRCLTSGEYSQFRDSLVATRLDVSIIQDEDCIYLKISPKRGDDKNIELLFNGIVVSSFSDTFIGSKDGRQIKSIDVCWSYLPSDYELLGDVKHFKVVRLKDHLLSMKGKMVPVFLLNKRMDELHYERRRDVLEGAGDLYCIVGDGFNVSLDCERCLIRVLYKLNAYRSVDERDAFLFVLTQWIPYARYECPVWQDIKHPLQAESILEKHFQETERMERENWSDLKQHKEKYYNRYRSEFSRILQDFPSLSDTAKTSEAILLEGWSAENAGPRRQRYSHVLLFYLGINRKEKKVIQKRNNRASKRLLDLPSV